MFTLTILKSLKFFLKFNFFIIAEQFIVYYKVQNDFIGFLKYHNARVYLKHMPYGH